MHVQLYAYDTTAWDYSISVHIFELHFKGQEKLFLLIKVTLCIPCICSSLQD